MLTKNALFTLPKHLIAGLCLAFMLSACGGGGSGGSTDSPTTQPASSSNLVFDKLGAAVPLGETTDITVTPYSGTLDSLTVSSSDPGVATVSTSAVAGMSETITVSGVANGAATISVSTAAGDTRSFPVSVYDPTVMDTGDMLIKVVDTFDFRWNDSGSGANQNVSIWQPKVPAGYSALGNVSATTYASSIDGSRWAIVVKDKGTNPSHPPLVPPDSYELLYAMPCFNSCASILGMPNLISGPLPTTVSMWRPVCPTNLPDQYVALGTYAGDSTYGGGNTNNPPTSGICIRADLTDVATDTQVWSDAGSGSGYPYGTVWNVSAFAPTATSALGKQWLSPGSCIFQPDTGRTDPLLDTSSFNLKDLVRVLKVDPQVLVYADYTGWKPPMTSTNAPINVNSLTQPIFNTEVLVPITGFDPAKYAVAGSNPDLKNPTLDMQVNNAPFHVLQRQQFWKLIAWNNSGGTLNTSEGTSSSTTLTSWTENSFSISASAGFEFKGVSGSVTATMTTTLGYSSASTVGNMSSVSNTVNVPVPLSGSFVSEWQKVDQFSLTSENGQDSFLAPWGNGQNAYYSVCYPQACP